MLSPTECQAARGRLQWTRERLAREAGLDVATVTTFELEQKPADPAIVAALTGALEAAGAPIAGNDDVEIMLRLRGAFA
jgi:transcriptional regulator with XRE-family HTH domain